MTAAEKERSESVVDWADPFGTAPLPEWLRDADGAHDVSHIRRVWQNARIIVLHENVPVDLEVLRPAVLFHDLVSPPKNDRNRARASRNSADRAVEILRHSGFPPGKLDAVHHAIAAHSVSAEIEPRTVEARIIQDADRLDALGAVGLARAFFVAGTIGQPLFDPQDPFAVERRVDSRSFALDHVQNRLFRIAHTMQTRTGHKLAQERLAVMRRFLDLLALEMWVPPAKAGSAKKLEAHSPF